MVATLYLIGCVLVPAQPPPPAHSGERLSGPRLARSQEYAYHGTYDEESVGDRVRFCRSYRVDTKMFVLETVPTGADVAVMTVLRPRDSHTVAMPAGVSGEPAVNSARLEIIRVDLQGHVSCDPMVNLATPLDGPPTIECGAFVELPPGRAASDGVWAVSEPGRPPRTWQRKGNEMVNGTSCVKITGEQQSEDWDKPRADRGAWRRTDTVWIASRLGVAFRVERLIERREAALRDATHKYVLRYELDSSLQYPGQLSDERRLEINRARAFSDAAAPLLATPSQYGQQLTALLSRINLHIEHQPPTPYRDAVVQVRKQVEAARRGETPAAVMEESADKPSVAVIGQAAPDFVATDFTAAGTGSARLRNWLGRPVLMVFYNPTSVTTEELLHFAKSVDSRFNGAVAVIGMSVSDDAKIVRKQQAELGLGFPILSGSGLRISYEVESTPKLILIDATGVVRGSYLGWGRETAGEVMAEIRQWLQRR
jgi:peroxiredoxin